MTNLTRLWFSYSPIPVDKRNCIFTSRIFVQKLTGNGSPLYLLVNTLSGAIDLLSSKEGLSFDYAITTSDCSKMSDQLFEMLVERGYIFRSKEIENIVFDAFINDYKNRKYTKDKLLGYFALDTSCSMGCKYCFEKQRKKGNYFEHSVMDQNSIIRAFDFLKTMCSLQKHQVDFVAGWGGEPLKEENYDINKCFIENANKNNFPIAYFSNLAFIGDRLTELLKNNSKHIKFLQTTIDGLYDEHDKYRKLPNAFDITVKNIDKLLNLNLPVIVRTNIGADNIDALPDIARFYKERGWFDFPKFKGYITHTYDRHHEFTKSFTLSEDVAVSKYLKFRDEFPEVRKIQGIKFGPSLKNILNAFKIRENLDVTEENFQIEISPTITYCYTSNRCEYVFTGAPNYSLYTCAECTALSNYKLGTYYPNFEINTNQSTIWDMHPNIHKIRSIDTLKKCKGCRAATFCGGYCALEAITSCGTASDVCCKHADTIISNFLRNESDRLYNRAKLFIDNTENITL